MNAISITHRRPLIALAYALCTSLLISCGGGSSGGGNNSDWPASIIGERIEFTVVRDISSGVAPGQTVVYDFNTDGQVQGTNPVTGQVLTPTSYTYSHSGNNARIRLNYHYTNGGAGYEDYVLKGGASILLGTYEYEAVVTQGSGSGGKATGNYRIIVPSAYPIGLEDAEPLTGNALKTLEALRFEDNLQDFRLAGSWSHGYIALRKDGSISTYAPQERLPTPCNNPPCTRLNPILLSPTGTGFVDVRSPSVLFGNALTEEGTLIAWGGEAGSRPEVVNFAGDGKVRALIDGIGFVVLMEDGTLREPLCIPGFTPPPADCAANTATPAARHLGLITSVSNIRHFHNSVAVDASGIVHVLQRAGGNPASEFESQDTPSGLPVIVIAKRMGSLIIALDTNGKLHAWNQDDLSWVTLPTAAANDVADFEITVTTDPIRYHVATVKKDGSAFLWSHDENLALLSSARVREPGTVRSVRYAGSGWFLFIR